MADCASMIDARPPLLAWVDTELHGEVASWLQAITVWYPSIVGCRGGVRAGATLVVAVFVLRPLSGARVAYVCKPSSSSLLLFLFSPFFCYFLGPLLRARERASILSLAQWGWLYIRGWHSSAANGVHPGHGGQSLAERRWLALSRSTARRALPRQPIYNTRSVCLARSR